MNEQTTALNRQTYRRLLGSVASFLKSSAGRKARWLLAGLLLLMVCINGMNVANSYVGRFFMSAIESRDTGGFVRYAWLIQLIPVLIVAPLFIQGKVEFGVIGQSAMAFATLLGAFSLVITQFQAISTYAAVVSRLGEFGEATDKLAARQEQTRIEITYQSDSFVFTDLTLLAPTDDASVLVKDLNVRLEPGRRVIVHGPNRAGRIALFRAAAGLHGCGTGTIDRPPAVQAAFLPEQSYLPTCTLRELLVPADAATAVTDDQIHELLAQLGLTAVVKPEEDPATPRNWLDLLSFEEEKLMAVARAVLAKPRFAFLDELESALDEPGCQRVLELMTASGITCVLFRSQPPGPADHDACLELHADGSWTFTPTKP